MSKLSEIMDFDHVIRVEEDGTISEPEGIYAPQLLDDELDSSDWELLNGYSGQDRYAGPIMHNSELIGGAIERDILDTPGVYVAIVSYYTDDDEPMDDTIAEGWAIAKLIEKD